MVSSVARAPRTVVVLRFSSAGDVVLTAAAVDALAQAWPDARIVFATRASYADLVRHNPQVHSVVTLEEDESVWSLRRRLAALRPDAVLDLHGKLRGVLLRSLVPARARSVWRNRPWQQSLAVRLGLARYRASSLVADRYHAAVERLVGRVCPPGRLRYIVASAAAARAEAELETAGIDLARPLCGMSPGSLWETKRWPVEYFGELAARLVADGYQVALAGSGSEAPVTAAVCVRAPGAVDLGGRLGLVELGGLIARCSVFVANDSGPMHMARALGVPTVALFGSTDPGQFDFTGHAALFLGLECSPCSLYGKHRCPLGHFRCMRDLHVDRVHAAVRALAAAPRPAIVRG